MSDERLRDLERRWKETGDPQHGAAWLRERVRVGALDEKRLRHAALLGDPPSVLAADLEQSESLIARVEALLRENTDEIGLRVLHALLEAALPAWETEFGPATGMEVIAKALRSQIVEPELEIDWDGLHAWASARHAWASAQDPRPEPAVAAANVVAIAAEVVDQAPLTWSAEDWSRYFAAVSLAVGQASAINTERVIACLGVEVVPVLLEGSDPLAERPDDLSLGAFWSLIAVAREEGGEDGQADRLTELLAEQSFSAVIDYELHFGECFWRAYREDLWDAAFLMNGGCSDDGFTDFRYGLIGQGSAVYEAAIADPDTLSSLGERAFVPNESLGYAGWRALETKCGSPDAVLPQLVRGWYPVQELVRTGSSENYAERFPKLWALFSENVD